MTDAAPTPSDELADVRATGRTDIGTAVVSMSARETDGRDAEYLAWHTLDHRPEQYRLAALRGSLRLVSTPECRAARAAGEPPFDDVDHVMAYFFAGDTDLGPFFALGAALHAGGRMPVALPSVELGVYRLAGAAASPRVLVGADVVPWRPALGAYLLLERGAGSPGELVDIEGVAGVWWWVGTSVAPLPPADTTGMQLTICWLDDDPVAVAERMVPVVDARRSTGAEPRLAAPFHVVVPYAWERYLP